MRTYRHATRIRLLAIRRVIALAGNRWASTSKHHGTLNRVAHHNDRVAYIHLCIAVDVSWSKTAARAHIAHSLLTLLLLLVHLVFLMAKKRQRTAWHLFFNFQTPARYVTTTSASLRYHLPRVYQLDTRTAAYIPVINGWCGPSIRNTCLE